MKLVVSVVFLFVIYGHSEIMNNFKAASNKSSYSKMENIDYIYMINLDERPEKWTKAVKQLHPFGIFPYRFSAVNGWKLSLEVINEIGVKYTPGMDANCKGTYYDPNENFAATHEDTVSTYGKTYFSHHLKRGAIGIALSHLSVLYDAYYSGYNTIMVFEDDIEVISDPRKIPDLVDELDRTVGKRGWDILYLDRDTRNSEGKYVPALGSPCRLGLSRCYPSYFSKKVGRNFRKISARFGTYSMIIRRSGMEKILRYYRKHQIFFPCDIEYALPKKIKLYTVERDVISHDLQFISDNGMPRYLESSKKFNISK